MPAKRDSSVKANISNTSLNYKNKPLYREKPITLGCGLLGYLYEKVK